MTQINWCEKVASNDVKVKLGLKWCRTFSSNDAETFASNDAETFASNDAKLFLQLIQKYCFKWCEKHKNAFPLFNLPHNKIQSTTKYHLILSRLQSKRK